MNIQIAVTAALVLVFAPIAAGAQEVAVELRGGGAIGNHTPAAAGLETLPGPSFAAVVSVAAMEYVSVYGTFVRSSFGCEEGFCIDRDVQITSTGFGGGARVHPLPYLWGQAGLLLLSTNVDTSGIDESGDGQLGYEVGAGLSFPPTGRFAFVPSVAYRADLDSEARTAVITAEIGVRIRVR